VSGADPQHPPLLLDVDDLPRRYAVKEPCAQRRAAWSQVVLGLAYAGLQWAWGPGQLYFALLGAGYVVLGVLGLVALPRVHLRLEPEGVRRVGVLGRGQLTRWSEVGEVRIPDAWHTAPHLRGHGRFAETTDLGDMTVEQARELQRRLVEARRRAASTAPGDESDEAQV